MAPSYICRRCGECCRRGGPTLHAQDVSIFAPGLIEPRHLFTMRAGTLAHDNLAGRVIPIAAEMIKIAGRGGPRQPWHCVFHLADGGCAVYADRPAQCRELFCENPRSLARLLAGPRLSRREVLPFFSAQWLHLALAHEQECALGEVMRLAGEPGAPERARLNELVRFDQEFRMVCAERGLVPMDAAPLVFGRSLRALLQETGFALGPGGRAAAKSSPQENL